MINDDEPNALLPFVLPILPIIMLTVAETFVLDLLTTVTSGWEVWLFLVQYVAAVIVFFTVGAHE